MANKLQGDFDLCVKQAQLFYKTAVWCRGSDVSRMLDGYMYPYIVNISLSCELYIKAIMIALSPNDEFLMGHELDKLFTSLDANIQQQIELVYDSKCNKALSDFLSCNSSAFVDWRYAFEKETVTADITAFEVFADSLSEYIDTYIISKNVRRIDND